HFLHFILWQAQDIRPDGRQFLAFRPASVNVRSITQADGSAIFKIGNSTVVCGIKAELTTPKAETPDRGYVVPNVELPPLCSPKFRPGPPSDQAQIITKLIDSVLVDSSVLDFKDLCICKDKLVWVLYCDLVCIDYDGSITDACIGALVSALKTLTLPEVSYNSETGSTIVHPVNRKAFPVQKSPVSTTFAIFDDQLLVADPTEEEETLSLGRIIIVTNEQDLCCIYKPGGIPTSQDILLESLSKAKKRAELIRKLINSAISAT
ncbi:exosome complex component RRP43, partial [Orussus abietinus]|uniref:exosome complex component RRP43 n=1 Tax=Orussus abietinus TaxID=222816 RepID=UPI000626C712